MANEALSVLTFSDAAHLLRRAGFGGRRHEVEALVGLTRAGAVERLLTAPAPEPSSDTPGRHAHPETDPEGEFDLWIDAVHYWLDRMASTGSPFQEKLTLFWHGHFTSSQDKLYDPRRGWKQIQLLRRAGAGDFHTLLQHVAIDPAMLRYLDNESNTKAQPQENWAREALELFTLGPAHYAQADVVGHARAWTGHGLAGGRFDQQVYEFHPGEHDGGRKTIFGIARNWNGPEVLTEICTGARGSGRRDVMARFIAAKVWSFFAHPGPDPAVVDHLAAAFVASGLSVTELVRAVFLHDGFWAPSARNGLVRSPTEYVVAALRGVGRPALDVHPEWYMNRMGQELLNPPNVSGWPGNESWVSTSAISARASFARRVMWGALDPATGWGFPVVQATCSPDSGYSDAQLVSMVLDAFGVYDPSETTTTTLVDYVASKRRTGYVAHNLFVGALCCPEMHLG